MGHSSVEKGSGIKVVLDDYEAAMRERLTDERYMHVCAVRSCASELAILYGVDQEEAETAGLLHDYAREIPPDELLRTGRSRNLIICEIEEKIPLLLHGSVGAELVKEELGISNPRVLEAIALHTLGGPAMGRLAQIIYIADMIAPGRDFPSVGRLRDLAREDIDQALLECIASTISYCLRRCNLIHPQTIAAWNFYAAVN